MENQSSRRPATRPTRPSLDLIIFVVLLVIVVIGSWDYFFKGPVPFCPNDVEMELEKFLESIWQNESASTFCVQNGSEINAEFRHFKLGENGCQLSCGYKGYPMGYSENVFVRCDFILGSLVYSMNASQGVISCRDINQTMTFLLNWKKIIDVSSIRILDGTFIIDNPITSNVSILAANFLTHLAKDRAKIFYAQREDTFKANVKNLSDFVSDQGMNDLQFCSKGPKSCSITEVTLIQMESNYASAKK